MAGKSKSPAVAGEGEKSLKSRVLTEMKKYVIITLYLWILFALFGLYKKELLRENGINYWNQSYAIINAMIFAKVMLLGEMLNLGARLRRHALIWAVLGKSLLFTVLLIVLHPGEEMIRAWIKHLPVMESVLNFGGGTWLGILLYAALLFVTLVPLFAFREVSDAMGKDQLWKMLISPADKR